MTAPVVPLRPADDGAAAAREALATVHQYLDRCKLSANTVKAYKRHATAYVAWLDGRADHGDAFADLVGAEGAVTAWRRHMVTARSSPSTINQALAAVTLMYRQAGIRIAVKRARIPRPGEPDALTPEQEGAVRRAALRRGSRDAAIIAVLLDTGARVEECARLDVEDFAITARTGEVRLPWSPPGLTCAAATPVPSGSGSAARSLSPASLRSCSPPVPTLAFRACARTAVGTPSPRCSAGAAPTPRRSRPCSDTPLSTPRPGTSAPGQPRTPPSSSESSTSDRRPRCAQKG